MMRKLDLQPERSFNHEVQEHRDEYLCKCLDAIANGENVSILLRETQRDPYHRVIVTAEDSV